MASPNRENDQPKRRRSGEPTEEESRRFWTAPTLEEALAVYADDAEDDAYPDSTGRFRDVDSETGSDTGKRGT